MNLKMKDKGTAYLWWFFTGLVGGHRFYLGKPFTGMIQAVTFGGLGLWVLIDLFTIPYQVARFNKKHFRELKEIKDGIPL